MPKSAKAKKQDDESSGSEFSVEDDAKNESSSKSDASKQGKKKKKFNCCQKCCWACHARFTRWARRSFLLVFAGWEVMYAVCSLVFVSLYSSSLHVARPSFQGVMRHSWFYCIVQSTILLTALIGFTVVWMRRPVYCRMYFFVMPVSLFFSLILTIVMLTLNCRCESFKECSALQDYIKPDDTFINPYPAPMSDDFFASQKKQMTWSDPYEKGGKKKSSSLLEHDQIEDNTSMVLDEIGRFDPSQKRLRAVKNRPISSRPMEQQIAGRTLPLQSRGQECETMSPRSGIMGFGWRGHCTPTVQTVNESLLMMNKSFALSGKIDIRLAYQTGKSLAAIYHTTQGEICASPQEINGQPGFKKRLLTCRRDSTIAVDTKCPDEIGDQLRACARDERCGALKVSVSDHPLEDMSARASEEGTWYLHTCMLMGTLNQLPSKDGDIPDTDEKWDTDDPLQLFFPRDDTSLLVSTHDGGDRLTVRKLGIAEQAKKNDKEWLEYMLAVRNSKCHCLPTSDSCSAFWEDPKKLPRIVHDSIFNTGENMISYWCKIDSSLEDICRANSKPTVRDLKEFPTSKTGEFWSQDLCRKKPKISKGREQVKPRCTCLKGVGYRPQGSSRAKIKKEFLDKKNIIGDASALLIGQRCEKWNQGDEHEWCIVGFDSACPDREEVTLSSAINLRLWKSALACNEDAITNTVQKARSRCRIIRFAFWFVDLPRYMLFPWVYAILYYWLKNRCRDGDSQAQKARQGWGEEDIVNEGDEDLDFPDEESELDFPSEEDSMGDEVWSSEASDQADKKKKKKSKKKQAEEDEDDDDFKFSDEEDVVEDKKKKKKKGKK